MADFFKMVGAVLTALVIYNLILVILSSEFLLEGVSLLTLIVCILAFLFFVGNKTTEKRNR